MMNGLFIFYIQSMIAYRELEKCLPLKEGPAGKDWEPLGLWVENSFLIQLFVNFVVIVL